jgi:hypothetical protein
MKLNKGLKGLAMVLTVILLLNLGRPIFAANGFADYYNEFDSISGVEILKASDNYVQGVFEKNDIKIEFTEKTIAPGITELNTIEDGIPHHVIINSNTQSIIYDGEFISVKDLEFTEFSKEELKNGITPLWTQTYVKKGSVEVDDKIYKTITYIAAAIAATIPGGLPTTIFLGVAEIWRDEGPYDKCYYIITTVRTTDGSGMYPYKDIITIEFFENYDYTALYDTVETIEWPLLP